jgi:hypothetical protein
VSFVANRCSSGSPPVWRARGRVSLSVRQTRGGVSVSVCLADSGQFGSVCPASACTRPRRSVLPILNPIGYGWCLFGSHTQDPHSGNASCRRSLVSQHSKLRTRGPYSAAMDRILTPLVSCARPVHVPARVCGGASVGSTSAALAARARLCQCQCQCRAHALLSVSVSVPRARAFAGQSQFAVPG